MPEANDPWASLADSLGAVPAPDQASPQPPAAQPAPDRPRAAQTRRPEPKKPAPSGADADWSDIVSGLGLQPDSVPPRSAPPRQPAPPAARERAPLPPAESFDREPEPRPARERRADEERPATISRPAPAVANRHPIRLAFRIGRSSIAGRPNGRPAAGATTKDAAMAGAPEAAVGVATGAVARQGSAAARIDHRSRDTTNRGRNPPGRRCATTAHRLLRLRSAPPANTTSPVKTAPRATIAFATAAKGSKGTAAVANRGAAAGGAAAAVDGGVAVAIAMRRRAARGPWGTPRMQQAQGMTSTPTTTTSASSPAGPPARKHARSAARQPLRVGKMVARMMGSVGRCVATTRKARASRREKNAPPRDLIGTHRSTALCRGGPKAPTGLLPVGRCAARMTPGEASIGNLRNRPAKPPMAGSGARPTGSPTATRAMNNRGAAGVGAAGVVAVGAAGGNAPAMNSLRPIKRQTTPRR